MSLHLDEYRIERLLRRTSSSEIWSAVREHDGLAVLAKSFSVEGNQELEARVEREFDLLRRLDIPGVIKALSLERSGRNLVLVLERRAGVDLQRHCDGQALPLDEFYAIAIQIAEVLAEVHLRHIVHRDLKPANILIDPATGSVALADFGISALLDSERSQLHSAEVLEGTLPYMAPEQTGRTGREVDCRSDLYAVGVCFYELLTGCRPFEAHASPLELIHAHLARRPPDPRHLRPQLSPALSALVLKLLEKAPERRYQSARGLAVDLQILRTGTLDAAQLGRADASTTLALPYQLYGRDAERDALLGALQQSSAGTTQVVILSGPAGVGKSALLDELVEPIIACRGFLARGKFEAEAEQPFVALRAAVASLADQLLTESPEALARWRERLDEALKGLSGVLCELVPSLQRVLTEVDEELPEFTPSEAQNRVTLAFLRLFGALARPQHPLVLALDDLHWADAASLELLDRLLAQDMALLVAITARPRRDDPRGRVAQLRERARTRGHALLELELEPLSRDELGAMIADTLSQSREAVAPLVEIVARKTGSNPFFAGQFLLLLTDMGVLERGPNAWRWDLATLEQASLPEDALEMMSAKIESLAPALRELLCDASVFGSRFDPLLVEPVSGHAAALTNFVRLVEEGLLAPAAGGGYAFGHDRIREAALALLDPERRRELHLAAGEALLERADGPRPGAEAQIFELVDHLDRGHGLVAIGQQQHASMSEIPKLSAEQLERLASLNLQAGRRALTSGASGPAGIYLDICARLLTALEPFPELGAPHRALHFETLLARAQVASVLREHARADELFEDLLAKELAPDELARTTIAHLWQLTASSRRKEAVEHGCATLRRLGIALPAKIGPLQVVAVLPKLSRMLRNDAIVSLKARADIKDARQLAAIDVFVAMSLNSYSVAPETFVLCVARHADLLERHGTHISAPLVFAQIGLILANAIGKRREAVELGSDCAAIEQARGPHPLRHRFALLHMFLRLWSDNLLELAQVSAEVLEASLQAGDIDGARSCWWCRIGISLWGGLHLRSLQELIAQRERWQTQWGAGDEIDNGELVVMLSSVLIEGPAPAPDSTQLVSLGAATDHPEPDFARIQELITLIMKAMVFMVFTRWSTAHTLLESAGDELDKAMPGMWYSLVTPLLSGLAAAALASEAQDPRARRRLRRRAAARHRKLRKMAEGGANVRHGQVLLAAELASLAGDFVGAARLYEQALTLAAAQRITWLEAMICERLAEHSLRAGLEHLALAPLQDARARYEHWGAFAKVAQLDQRWPQLAGLQPSFPVESLMNGVASTATSHGLASQTLDAVTVLEATRTLAADIDLGEVVAQLLRLAAESAGAQRGALLLPAGDSLAVAARFDAELGKDMVTRFDEARPLAELSEEVPAQVLRWCARTHQSVVLDDAREDLRFAGDAYLVGADPCSLLCWPMVKQGALVGMIYLENSLSAGAFAPERLETLGLLAAQGANVLDNARLYADLRQSELRWRSLVEQLPDYVAIATPDGELEIVSDLDEEGQILAPYRAQLDVALAQIWAGATLQELDIGELDTRCMIVRVAPMASTDTRARALVIATDVSERRRAEAEGQRLASQLRQQQRLESIGTLASGVAHEINNPLQGIMAYAELALDPAVDMETMREFVSEIHHESDRMATIVRNLLRFSRRGDEQEFTGASVTELIEGTLSLVRTLLRRDDIALDLNIPPGLPLLRCRSQQIQQVIMNLVTNARDALNERYPRHHANKRIELSAQLREQSPAQVRICVRDWGAGIPDDLRDRIFSAFFTTKAQDRGTGLGLSISHKIASEHSGQLSFDTQPGVGTSFYLDLPLAASDPAGQLS